ncbi:9611_t:CDS:2 [Funneliformis mosseae]|uniref:9611_t:CDS:1 n=1 Tax=Funneliformis mosseae TaxID=27381 RepID=A0A9N9CNF0_FUNMO|nr:9611_t:CDS:2 [Funneliformis mosseae]
MGRTSIFNQAENELILEWMQRNPNHPKNSYTKLSKELAKISSIEKSSKQIRQHWSNNLNPALGLMQQKFNKLYSENTIKNFLHTRKRKLGQTQKSPKLKVYEPKPSPPKFNMPPPMNPIFD